MSTTAVPLRPIAKGSLTRLWIGVAIVALAAKMARIIWAVLRSGRPFEMAASPSAG